MLKRDVAVSSSVGFAASEMSIHILPPSVIAARGVGTHGPRKASNDDGQASAPFHSAGTEQFWISQLAWPACCDDD
jgi:hypothetical protein